MDMLVEPEWQLSEEDLATIADGMGFRLEPK